MSFTTRFAPSPTGPLHLGHAYSAILAHDRARAAGGRFLLRIDDLDTSRCRPEYEAQIFDDLAWLGLDWPRPVLRQSERLPSYRAALQRLWDMGLLYPCTCSRADIRAAASAPQEGAPAHGPDGLIYPGTCRPASPPSGAMPDLPLRLDMAHALARLDAPLVFTETGAGPAGETGRITSQDMINSVGDVALARPGLGASYHLSVVVDDAAQDITHVIRGQDLFAATQIHVLLQHLLGLAVPLYHHHRLIRDSSGKRLAKRDDARAIATCRAQGESPDSLRASLGL
ncbi:MAG: tRNA glutamyl-Q(34) synthetase GluQRS [Pseudomonadota bacterium]|uniref:tRNA glutamyl-Q(34) synthetase GluQRS n=1 Tax=Roseovarius TaxID=74030 RepID=UPI0022A7BA1A|nr:tRNA glutamyl-Q(34) synthetase GluQRS [Roseovarius sp. EGI FJ00037]MCZ0811024.1 tRNA glutamyl-Q(34) synthetase GluQRS [Roseovarius sp. EGI FJ00037]